jgi:hypothetical protein
LDVTEVENYANVEPISRNIHTSSETTDKTNDLLVFLESIFMPPKCFVFLFYYCFYFVLLPALLGSVTVSISFYG